MGTEQQTLWAAFAFRPPSPQRFLQAQPPSLPGGCGHGALSPARDPPAPFEQPLGQPRGASHSHNGGIPAKERDELGGAPPPPSQPAPTPAKPRPAAPPLAGTGSARHVTVASSRDRDSCAPSRDRAPWRDGAGVTGRGAGMGGGGDRSVGPRSAPLSSARRRCRALPAVLALCAAAWSCCAAGRALERDQPFR